jgi:ubiquinone/menaquinone biosynthesis C-methylase UbiE
VAKLTKKLPSGIPIGMELLWGGWSPSAAIAAIDLDVFTTIASGNDTASDIAGVASANENMMRRLLDALVALKLLTRKGDRYALTRASATYLVRGSDLYMENADRIAIGQMMGWSQLANVVRTGTPVSPQGGPEGVGQFFAMLVKAIFPPNYVAGREAVESIPRNLRSRIEKVLDIAAGAAAWSIPFAQANRATRVTVVDMPQVTPVTREYAAKFGVAEQFDYLEGDMNELDFGKDRYDVVTLGHVIHGAGRDGGRRLIGRCAEALRNHGMLLIAEFIPNDDRTGPLLPMLFGLNMMLHTPVGDVFTIKEYRGWLKEAGFKTVKVIKTPAAPSPLILATK